MIRPDIAGCRVEVQIPVQVLPWRDIRVIEKHGGRRAGYGCCDHSPDPLADAKITLKGPEVQERTDITGAEGLQLQEGVATVTATGKGPLFIPCLRIAEGAKMPAYLRVRRPKLDEKRRYVHVAQYAGGQLMGGVTLRLTTEKEK